MTVFLSRATILGLKIGAMCVVNERDCPDTGHSSVVSIDGLSRLFGSWVVRFLLLVKMNRQNWFQSHRLLLNRDYFWNLCLEAKLKR